MKRVTTHYVRTDPRLQEPGRPDEVPMPHPPPEGIPAKEPAPGTWPQKGPEIDPGEEPLTAPETAPQEIPPPPEGLDNSPPFYRHRVNLK